MPPIQNKPTSKVWRYFSEGHSQFAQCLLCKYHPVKGVALHVKVAGSSGASTQAMRNHLKCNHLKQFDEMENEYGEEQKQKNHLGLKESVKPKIEDTFRKLTKIEPGVKKQSNNLSKEKSKNILLTSTISSQMTKTGIQLQIGNKKSAEWACLVCQKRGCETNVFIHVQRTHQGNNTGKPLPCKVCGSKERSIFAMMTHMGKMHARKHA